MAQKTWIAGETILAADLNSNFTNLGGKIKFGGTGADGALTVSSGTTSISAGSAKLLVKNYSSISITGTGAVEFTTPHASGTVIVLKVTGNVTLTSSATPMLSAAGMGALGAPANTYSTDSNNNGSAGTAPVSISLWSASTAGGGTAATPGVGGTAPSPSYGTASLYPTTSVEVQMLAAKYPFIFVGGGGGEGAGERFDNGNVVTGGGSRGGGALVVECGGDWNFTTASGISVAGVAGLSASGTSTRHKAGGGGGGGGGYFFASYTTLVANSGTVVVSGGVGGSGSSNTSGGSFSQDVGSGAGGASYQAGNAGTGNSAAPTGGTGANGLSLIGANTNYA